MSSPTKLSHAEVEAALAEIDALAQQEYGLTLQQVLQGDNAELCMLRLSGVLLKRPFATSHAPGSYNPTESKRSWWWDEDKFEDPALAGTPEHKVLKQIRDDMFAGDWQGLKNFSHEAGLMMAVGRWLKSQFDEESKTFKQCYYHPSSPETNLVVNIANFVPFASLMAGAVGTPVLAVQLALFATQYGYEKLTEPQALQEE